MRKVLIPTKLDTIAAEMLKERDYPVVQDAKTPLPELLAANADAEVLIVRSEEVTAEVIDALPQLRLVVRAGAGYNTIDVKHARRRNVDVMNTPGANANAVAEEVVAMILAALRHVVRADVTTRAGLWEKKDLMGRELADKTLGILGMGNIGRLVAKRLAGFDLTVLAYDPVLSADLAGKLGVRLATVEEIFAAADVVTLHIPQTPETKGMVNRQLLETMKPGAILVNCSRAGIVNENDLRAVKAAKKIQYCTDVYPKDEPGPKPVADIADLMLPHLGASTHEANWTAAKRAAEQTLAYFEKGVTNCVVNKGVPDGLDARFQELAFVLARLARCYLGTDGAPHQVETSFYGQLHAFGKWLLAPIVAGIAQEFDPYQDASDAEAFLKGRGIVLTDRDVDDHKRYGEAMTVDLIEGSETLRKVSVRGTIVENRLMISRVNDYDKLYLEPTGHNLFVEYADKPGVLGKIAGLLGRAKINIIDVRAPQDLAREHALAAIKTDRPVPAEMIAEIAKSVHALNAFTYSY
jgi:D-3-phosphoglycerate dehydrogenase